MTYSLKKKDAEREREIGKEQKATGPTTTGSVHEKKITPEMRKQYEKNRSDKILLPLLLLS